MDDAVPEPLRISGRRHELEFWRSWISHDGSSLSPRATNWCEAAPNPELEIEVHLLLRGIAFSINQQQGRSMQLLDIGSGPISILSRSFDDLRVEMQAADPLGDDYDALWPRDLRHKFQVCRPKAVSGEELFAYFGRAKFDVAHIRNAIDHTVHPMKVVEQMIEVVRGGGFIIVHGFENEALAEGWSGFHQWNMRVAPYGVEFAGKSGAIYRPLDTFSNRLKLIAAWSRPLPTQSTRKWASFVAAVA